jgi:general secretion pathway protein C
MSLTLTKPMSMSAFSSLESAEQLVEKVVGNRWTPIAVNLLAMLLLVYSLAQWSWLLLDRGSNVPRASARTAVTAPAGPTDQQLLLSANLFGQAAPGNLATDKLPLTSLNLVLTGVMVRGANSYALIRVEGGEETSVTVGEEVQAGTKLQAVLPDRVILLRGGVLESLMLKDSSSALPEGSIVMQGSNQTGALLNGISGSGNQFKVSRETLTRQMQRPEFLSQALMVPNSGGGFLVREIQPGSIYEKLGVRAGDVIRSINGQPINNMEEVMKVYQQLGGIQQASNITVEVTRAGHSELLQYNLE